MYPYVTCFCGCPLGHLYPAFRAMCAKHRRGPNPDAPIGYILDQLNIRKECCRVRIMTGSEFKDYYNVLNPIHNAPTIPMPDGRRASAAR
jgi:DNA-directed RNA polymerase subunit N (RpoN/RPB10)